MAVQRPSPLLLSVVAGALALTACGSTVQTRNTVSQPSSVLSGEQAGQPSVDPGTSGSLSGGTVGTGARLGTGGGSSSGTVPTGSGGSTTGSTGSPSRPTTGGTTGTSPLASAGPGWDQRSVYFGVPTEEDLSKTLGAAGISFYPGSIQGDVNAVVADVNAQGGLFGRKLVPVFHDNAAANVSSNPAAAAQANCAAFTQDRRVVAVMNPIAPIENDAFLQCMKKTRTPLLSIGYSTYADSVYARFGPYLYTTLTPNISRFIPSYIPALGQAGFYGGWNTTTGKPMTGSAVVGILEPDTDSGHTAADLQKVALAKQGVKVGSTYFYREDSSTYGSDMSAAILNFRNAGVTHLLDITNVAAGVLIFAETAQQQRYFPRYGMTSWLLPDTAASTFVQAGIQQQLNGSIGIGWTPGGDVNHAHDPGQTAVQKACLKALERQGVKYNPQSQRYAIMVAWALCDDVNLLVAAAKRGGGLSAQALSAGLGGLTSVFQPAVTFSSALSATNHSVPGSHRALVYDGGCTCFAYQGPVRSLG